MAGAGNPVVPELHVAVDDVSVQHARRADEARDERGGRLVVDPVGGAPPPPPALVHDEDPVRELERFVLVVGHQQAGDPELLMQVVEPSPELLAHPCIQRTERLVEQEDLGLGREGPRERNPLPLTTGELIRIAVPEPRELHELEEILHTSALLGLRLLADRQPERDVLRHRHVAEQREVLEDEADPPFLDGFEGVPPPPHPDPARRGFLQAGDHPEHGALAGAARSEERGDAARLGRERDHLHRLEPPEALPEVRHADRRAGHLVCGSHVRCVLSCRRLKTSIKTRRTIETSASVRATMNPWSSWNWSTAPRTYRFA